MAQGPLPAGPEDRRRHRAGSVWPI